MRVSRPSHRQVISGALVALAVTVFAVPPTPLHASTTTPLRTALCGYLAKAVTYLEAQQPSALRTFLLTEARRVYTARCT